jgi:secreted Zn-dependent insulinase-like peptidase
VQGSKLPANQVNFEVDKVISKLKQKIETEFNEDKLESFKEILKEEIQKPSTNLKDRSDLAWKEIILDSLDFKRQEKSLQEVDLITLEEIKSQFEKVFFIEPKKLSMQLFSQKNKNITIMDVKTEKYSLNDTIDCDIFYNLNN